MSRFTPQSLCESPVIASPVRPGHSDSGYGRLSRRDSPGKRSGAANTILVVNDSPDSLEMMKLLLSRAGYSVLTAFDGGEGFEVARRERPRLVVSDVSMPRVDGIELCRLIRAHADLRETPVLLVSAIRRDSQSVVEGLKAGADDYLEAPYDPALLLTKVAQLVEREETEEALRESQARLAGVVESAMDAIITVDGGQRVLLFNRAAEKMFRCAAADALGQPLDRFIPERFRAAHASHVPAFGRSEVSSRVMAGARAVPALRADGEEFPVEASISQVEAGGQKLYTVILRDITEHKQAEERLRHQLDFTAAITASMGEGVYALDEDGRLTFMNPAAEAALGWTEAELLGRGVHEVIHFQRADGAPRPAHDCPLLGVLTSGQTCRGEDDVFTRRDGTLLPVSYTAAPILTGGRVIGAVLAFRDITERLRAEEARERLATIVESSDDAILSKDLDGRVTSWNAGAERMYGYAAAEAIGRHVSFIVPPDRREELSGLMGRVARGERVGRLETIRVRKDGRRVEVSISIAPMKDGGGRVVGASTIARDITERKATERELRESEERYRDLVENALDIIYTQDLEGNYTSLNRAGEQITGYTREEALRMNVADVVAPECLDKARRMISAKLASDTETVYDLEIVTKDGRRVALEVNSRLIYQDGAPIGVQGIARDLTERKRLEEQFRQAQKMEAVGRLAGGVAHDFNNLLTVINGYSDITIGRLPAEDPLRSHVEEVRKAGERAAGLTRQLLAFSRKQVLQPEVIDLNEVVRETEKMLRRLIGEDIVLRVALGPGLGSVEADPGQVEQVLMNLAVNARDAMPRGGKLTIGTENVHLDEGYAARHVSVAPGRYVMLAVSDTGAGMDEETRARIFEPFFTTKGKGKGTGLGLSTVYGIVKQSGGHIWVYSEAGRGTTFKIYLPRVDAGAREHRPAAESAEGLTGTETILLAEDDELVRSMTRIILSDYGYRVLAAENGAAAISIFESTEEPIHLLLTDVVMPGISGRELADRLTRLRPETKVLYMSGYTDDAIVHHGVLEEGVNFLQKPFTPDALVCRVRDVLGNPA